MKKNYDFSSISYKLIVEEHIGLNEIGKFPAYEQELQDIATRYIYSLFYSPSDSPALRTELVTILGKYEPTTVSPYLFNYYL